MSISAIVMSFFSGVGVGKWLDQVVSSQRLETGGPQPSPVRQQPLTPGSCQAELMCDHLDVNAIKTNVLPGAAVSSGLLGLLDLTLGPKGLSLGQNISMVFVSLQAGGQQLCKMGIKPFLGPQYSPLPPRLQWWLGSEENNA